MKPSARQAEHFDVVIVGAGISGVGGAYHLTQQCPDRSFVVLEALEDFGGTWLTHTYPGIRSDSDLYTFGYRFKPWVGPPIATAREILDYMGEVIEENDLGRHIRYRHKITNASWSSADNLRTLDAVRTDTGEDVRFTTNFLWMCQGYYRHSKGYTPEWPGMKDYKGRIVHPQTWPADLIADFVCRLLNHMKATGAKRVVTRLRPEDADMPLLSWMDPENFNPGYLMRGMHLLPKRGDKPEWQHSQDYWTEKDTLPATDLTDGAFVYD